MNSFVRILAGFALLGTCTVASGAKNNFVPADVRDAHPARTVQAIVAQAEIGTDIVPSRITMATGGGLLFALIDAGVDAARTKKAEAAIQPVRAALLDYDFDTRIRAVTDEALADIAWLRAKPAELSKDASTVGMQGALDASQNEQVVFIRYRYGVNPDFSAIVVTADVDIANRTPPADQKKDDKRLSRKNLVYSQVMHSVARLPNPGDDVEDNAPTWAADNGSATRRALDAAVARMKDLLVFALSLSESEAAALNKRDRVAIGDYQGRQLEGVTGGTFLYDNPDIVFVQETAP